MKSLVRPIVIVSVALTAANVHVAPAAPRPRAEVRATAPGSASPDRPATTEPDSVGPPKTEDSSWDVATADLGPTRRLQWTVDEGTWISVDVSPDGTTLVFDVLGDIFQMPIRGGAAVRLRGGRSYDVQPRYSPDGTWISFTSDAGGGDNLWVMRADGSEARQVTDESFRLLNNAVWTPDGRSLVARKHFTSRRSLGAGEMWLYDVAAGGSGVQLTEKPTEQKDVGEPELSPDGRFLYYSLDATPGTRFEYNKDPNGRIYEIRRLDLQTGETETVIDVPGGSVRPEISPDGGRLAYVRRVRLASCLMVRDLATGEDHFLYDGLSQDTQETWSIFGAYPGFAWTPDGRALVIWARGKIVRVDATSGEAVPIPFTVDLDQEVTRALRFAPRVGESTVDLRVLRWPRVSPDGRRVVFQAVGHLWVRDLAAGEPRRLTEEDDFEFFPRWSPDGRRIVYTTWNDVEGGRVQTVAATGGKPTVLVSRPGHYAEPSFSSDGKQVVYRRGPGDVYRGERFATDPGVYVVPARGGPSRRVLREGIRPRFFDADRRIVVLELGETKRLVSYDLLGGDPRPLATSERAMEIEISPDGRWLAFEELWDVYVAPRPAVGRAIALGPDMKNLPVHRVSAVAGEFLDWSADGRRLRFGLGPDLFTIEVPPLFATAEPDSQAAVAERTSLGFSVPADIPSTNLAFVGATLLTMRGEEVVEDGVVRVRGNRITAVGRRGEVDVGGARIVDVAGKVLLPGFVDVHAHLGSSNMDTHARTNWAYLANLAFGVTTTHDPSNNTRMVFASSELVETGQILGPRIFSTGTVLYGAEGDFKAKIESLEDARRHLKRLKAYGAFSVKSYNQPRRNQRQWIIRAARDLGMMVVPEGGSMYGHNMTMILDGHTTLEHAIPLAPLYEDALVLLSGSETAYTPTLIVGYGGLWGENYWYQTTEVWANERLLRFVPRSVVDPRARRRLMAPEGDFHHMRLAATAAEILRRGGNVEVGAHGQMQGLGVHWEMWMFGQGGLTPMEVLQVATLHGAHALGLDGVLGSVEVGKLADLIVLDSDPRASLQNTQDVKYVMIDGRLFDARTLDQIAPEARPRPTGPDLESVPRDVWMGRCEGP